MNANLAVALRLAAANISVFPVQISKGDDGKLIKRPLIADWPDLASTEASVIAGWWRAYPDAVPGIAVGKAGLVIIDLDRHPGAPDGVAAFRDLRAGRELPIGPVTETASGGYHLAFRQPPGEPFTNARGNLPKGTDVRGAGGFVVAPGAVHPLGSWKPMPGRPTLESGPVPELPAWLVAVLRPSVPARRGEPHKPALGDAAASLRGLVRTVAGAPEGQRNQALFWASCRAGEAARDGKMAAHFAADVLLEAAAHAGLPRAEAQRTIRSGLQTGGRA